MGKPIKAILLLLTGIVLLLMIGVTAVLIFVDPNAFKPEIETAFKNNFDRTLTIHDDLELTFFPWIGLNAGKMTISNAPGFDSTPFASIAASEFKVKLLPLFSNSLEIKHVILDGLTLNLTVNKDGTNNWEDLTRKDEPTADISGQEQKHESVTSPGALALGGLSLIDSRLLWDDRANGNRYEIIDLNLHMDRLELNHSVPLELSFTALGLKPGLKQSVQLNTDLFISKSIDSFKLSPTKIVSLSEGEQIPGGQLKATILFELELNLPEDTALIENLQLNSKDLTIHANLTATDIQGEASLTGPVRIENFDLREYLQQLSIDLPASSDPATFGDFALQFFIQANQQSARFDKINLQLDDTTLTGSATLHDYTRLAYTFDLNIDAIDLDRYLPDESPASTHGQNSDDTPEPGTPAAAMAAATTLLPVESLRGLNAEGVLKIEHLIVKHLALKGIQLNFSAKQGALKSKQLIKDLYQGSYQGSLGVDVRGEQPRLSLDEKLSNLQIGEYLTARKSKIKMTGTASVAAKLHATGNQIDAIKSSLGGQIDFALKDGIVKGFNLKKIIESATSLLEGKPLPKKNKSDQTAFSSITGQIDLDDGIARNNDFLADSPELNVSGNGEVNLVKEKIDYRVIGRLIKTPATATHPMEIEGIPVHILVSGDLGNPVYTPDIVTMLKDKSNPEIEKKKQKLLDKVDKKFGPGAKDLLRQLF